MTGRRHPALEAEDMPPIDDDDYTKLADHLHRRNEIAKLFMKRMLKLLSDWQSVLEIGLSSNPSQDSSSTTTPKCDPLLVNSKLA